MMAYYLELTLTFLLAKYSGAKLGFILYNSGNHFYFFDNKFVIKFQFLGCTVISEPSLTTDTCREFSKESNRDIFYIYCHPDC